MTDIELIIKIPEEIYESSKRECEEIDDLIIDNFTLTIGKGTPLPKGHWIIIDDCEQFIAKCSKCGRIEDSRMINKYPYCHCGAKMQEEE